MNTLSLVFPLKGAQTLSAPYPNRFYRDTKVLVSEFNYYIALAASDGDYNVTLEVPTSVDQDAFVFVCACFEEEGYDVTINTGSECARVYINWLWGE